MRQFIMGLLVGGMYAFVHSLILIRTKDWYGLPWWVKTTTVGIIVTYIATLLSQLLFL